MRDLTRIILFAAVVGVLPASAQARPVRMSCSSSVDLYADPYSVIVDSKNMTVQIIKSEGPLSGRHAYQITGVNTASDNGYVVTADGRLFNSKIQVMVSNDEKWVSYSDALTNQAYSTDYCN
jgi:hypothetical protein